MLPIDWIFASYDGNTNVGFRELIISLSESPFDSLFSTELVITLNELMWKRYYHTVLYKSFIPFIVYFISAQHFVSNYAIQGIDPDQDWYYAVIQYGEAAIIIISVIYFLLFEIVVMLRNFKMYI